MPLTKIQKEVDDWIKLHKEGYWNPLEILARLTEETGELAREINHSFGAKRKKSSEENKGIEDEIGDILFSLVCLSNSLNINMNESFSRAMEKCRKRDKNRFEKE